MAGSPSKTLNISPLLTLEVLTRNDSIDTDKIENHIYNCIYKNYKIEYSEIRLSETRAHSIYENFNKIKYEICKFWFYNHVKTKDNRKLEMTLELIDYLKEKDFFSMNELDKVLLTILYFELIKLKKYYKDSANIN